MKTSHIETGSHVLRNTRFADGILTLVTDGGDIEVDLDDAHAGRIIILTSVSRRVDLGVSRNVTIWTQPREAAQLRDVLGIAQ